MQRSAPIAGQSARRGMVLIVVLVVVVLLSLGAYTFSEFMVIETHATEFHSRSVQARALADSGVEFVSVLLADRASLATVGLYHNPGLFLGHQLLDAPQAGGRGRFSIVAPVEGDPTSRQVRFGLIDESSKLNLNTVAELTPANSAEESSDEEPTDETTLINPLMGLPGMTQDVAEAIFDWIDEDDESRTYGAESEYYQSLAPPYECKNGKLETLDELLLVRGVTPQLLFGEDANRNGLLDPNENDGELTPPFDNGDGVLDRGWSAYLTVHSRELNLRADRTTKIDVNSNTLSDVYDKLEDELDATQAQFIVAYRLYGPVQTNTNPDGTSQGGQSGNQQGGQGSGGNSGGRSGGGGGQGNSRGGGGGGGGGQGGSGVNQVTPQQVAQAAGQALAGRSGTVTRGGMDLTNGGKFKINSIYDLIGVQVQGQIDGTNTLLESPWPAEPGAVSSYLPELLDLISTKGSEQYIEGRININQAHKAVLLGLPGMTEEIAQSIVGAQLRGANGEPLADAANSRATTMWLYTEGIVDLETLRSLDPYITSRGDVFRMQVLGHFDKGGSVARIEAIVDATQNPPQPIFFRDLTDLGRGYSLPPMSQ